MVNVALVSDKVRFTWEVAEVINNLLWGEDAPSIDQVNLLDIYSVDLFPYMGMSAENTALPIINSILDQKFNWSIVDWVRVQARSKRTFNYWCDAINFNIRLINDLPHGDYVPDDVYCMKGEVPIVVALFLS